MAEDNKKENKEVKSSKNTEKEVKNTKPKEQVVQLLHEIANALDVKLDKKNEETGISEEKYRVPSLRFQEISNKAYDSIADILNKKHDSIWKKYKIDVKLIDNIDIKDGSNEKFYIKLTDSNGNTTTIDLLQYQRNIYDYSVNEEESIKNQILRLKGIYDKDIVDASKEIADYISLALGYKEAFHYQYKLVGWDSIDNKVIFKYDKIYSKTKHEIKGFCGEEWAEALELKQVTEEEQKEAQRYWNISLAHTFNNKPKADILLCAAASGLVRQVLTYTKETNININIVGGKGSGKSTMEHFLLSFFGDPQYLEGSFVDTDNANEKIRAERAVIPFILDERMLKVEGQTDKKKAFNIIMDIFKEYEGKIKQKANSKSDNGLRTYGAVISSSVDSMIDQIITGLRDENDDIRDVGQFRRFIELDTSKGDLFIDGEHARAMENIAYNRYGYGIRQVVEYMLEMMKYAEYYILLLKDNDLSCEDIFELVSKLMDLEKMEEKLKEKEYETNLKIILGSFGNKISKGKRDELIDLIFDKPIVNEIEAINDDISVFGMFDALFAKVNEEVSETLKNKYTEEKHKNEMESSLQRFSLLALTGYILNYSIKQTLEDREKYHLEDFRMNINSLVSELLENLYEKLNRAGVFKDQRTSKEKRDLQKQKQLPVDEIQEIYESKIVALYDWFNNAYVQGFLNKYEDNEFIATYDDKGNKLCIKIQETTTTYPRRVDLSKLLNNTDATPEMILDYELTGNDEGLNKPIAKEIVEKILKGDLINIDTSSDRPTISQRNNRKAVAYMFNVDEIEKARKRIAKQNNKTKSQEESANETN